MGTRGSRARDSHRTGVIAMIRRNQFYSCVLALAFAFPSATVFAEQTGNEYAGFLSPDEQTVLAQTGELTGFGSKIDELTIWNRAPFADAIRSTFPNSPSTIAAEGFFLIDRPEAKDADDLNMKILKAFTSFSAMKGLLAYSDSKKKMETFIFDSSLVDSLQGKNRLSDPEFSSVPKKSTFTVYQKEEQTGDVYSRMTVDFEDTYDIVTLTNLTELKFMGLRLVAAEEMKTVFVIVPLADKIALYGVTVAKTPRLFGLERIKQKSFFYRMKALASWFQGNLAKN